MNMFDWRASVQDSQPATLLEQNIWSLNLMNGEDETCLAKTLDKQRNFDIIHIDAGNVPIFPTCTTLLEPQNQH